MTLLELFRTKPRWQHSDPNVRAEAVRALAAGEQALLANIARSDVDARVRRLATRKLTDLDLLAEIAGGDADAAVREEAREALVTAVLSAGEPDVLLRALAALTEVKTLVGVAKAAPVAAVRGAALERLSDAKALAQVAREANDAATRLAALAKVGDPLLRASIATSSEHRDVALAALDSLGERAMLKGIAARAKVKAVARRARAILDERTSEPEPLAPAERHARQSQICRTLEALSHAKDWDHVSDQLGEAEAEWRRLAPCPDAALAGRYEAAVRVVHAGLARLESELHERERATITHRAALTARQALCEQAEALGGEDVLARIETLQASWQQLAPLADPEVDALGKRFAVAVEASRNRVAAGLAAVERGERREALCVEIEGLAAAADLGAVRTRLTGLEREWQALSSGVEDDLTARVGAARATLEGRLATERATQAQREKENLARVTALVERLEAHAKAEPLNFREANRALREAGTIVADPGPLPSRRDRDTLVAKLESLRKKLYPRVMAQREDEDWKRWANLSVQEELCGEVEALAEVTDLDEVARRVKDIDARWKTAREAPRDQAEALRERFRKSREEIATRLEAHFARLDAERGENLKRKEELVARAEALADSTDWARTAQALRQLQEEWKTVGPVPRDSAEGVWQRFRSASERFFTRFKAHRQTRSAEWAENQKRKEELCARAEGLVESSEWEQTAAALRGLQDEWKKIGAVKRSQTDALWQRFRAACDAFFERYKRRDELAAAASLAECEALCQRLETLVPRGGDAQTAPDGLAAQLLEVQGAWRKAARVSGEALRPLAERFERAWQALVESYPAALVGTDLDPQLTLRKMEKLCGRVEALAEECSPGAGATSAADLAAQLRSALAANAMGGKAEREARWRTAREEVDEAQASWRRLGPVPAVLAEPLVERFKTACERFLALRPAGERDERRRSGGRSK